MSAAKRRLVVTAQARADLQGILRYTTQQWGRRQRGIYKTRPTAAMERLTRFPDLGPTRDDLPPGMHLHPVEQHVVYYLVDDKVVTIVRIVHGRMDAPPTSPEDPA